MTTPLVVVLGVKAHVAHALAEAHSRGMRVVRGWDGGEGDVCTGTVRSPEDAAAVLLAVVAGAGVVVEVDASPELADRLVEDLRRFGSVDLRTTESPPSTTLTFEQRRLLGLLADGQTLGSAARELGLARRTADRRLADARHALGVGTTAEAVVAFSRLGARRSS